MAAQTHTDKCPNFATKTVAAGEKGPSYGGLNGVHFLYNAAYGFSCGFDSLKTVPCPNIETWIVGETKYRVKNAVKQVAFCLVFI